MTKKIRYGLVNKATDADALRTEGVTDIQKDGVRDEIGYRDAPHKTST